MQLGLNINPGGFREYAIQAFGTIVNAGVVMPKSGKRLAPLVLHELEDRAWGGNVILIEADIASPFDEPMKNTAVDKYCRNDSPSSRRFYTESNKEIWSINCDYLTDFFTNAWLSISFSQASSVSIDKVKRGLMDLARDPAILESARKNDAINKANPEIYVFLANRTN